MSDCIKDSAARTMREALTLHALHRVELYERIVADEVRDYLRARPHASGEEVEAYEVQRRAAIGLGGNTAWHG